MTFDTLNAPGRPAAIIADFETAAGSGDLPVAEAMVRSLIRATVDAIRGRDIDALRNLGEAVEDFTGSRIEVIEKRAPRLAARVEHLLPIISEAMDLTAASAEELTAASLGPPQRQVLEKVGQAGGRLDRRRLAEDPETDRNNLSRTLAALEGLGLVERLQAPGAKYVTVQLTPPGRRVAAAPVGGRELSGRRQRQVANGPKIDTDLFADLPC